MKAVSTKPVRIDTDGKQVIEAVLISDETPETLPTTGEGIVGMSVDEKFAPFSIIYVVADVEHKIYIANESGVFVAQ